MAETFQRNSFFRSPDIETGKHLRHGHFAGTPGAIITFYCNAEPGMRDAAAVNAFRTAFARPKTPRVSASLLPSAPIPS